MIEEEESLNTGTSA